MIPQATPPRGYRFRDVQLELSLKPFWDPSPETRDAVLTELFEQWRPLLRFAESASVMLWIGDGSEILEYQGHLQSVLVWGHHIGSANEIGWHKPTGKPRSDNPDHDAIGLEAAAGDPERRGVHSRSYLYRPQPAEFTYGWLHELVNAIRDVGRRVSGIPVLVGSTFDIGPEFAVSRFKYEWHPEICGGGQLFGGKFIRCDAKLHGDSRPYAGFPNGIPDGTSVGTFLGRQTRCFASDMGIDFLWLSNGFGFALEPWALTGAVFDGKTFDARNASHVANGILEFWRDLRRELPDLPIRTRGTNLATGIDIGSDASPLRHIYEDFGHIEPPVNSPWAALDGDIGLELAGWMSHIAETSGRGYRFRYYIHDPWWLNSPWLDRYQRQPYDIFLPLSVSRIQANGAVEPPCDLSFLTCDDSHGCLPPQVPVEVTAHILHAREYLPDAPAPLIWVHPFDHYHEAVVGTDPRPHLPFFGDWFARGMIAAGIPLNTVVSWDNLTGLIRPASGRLKDSVLVAPAVDEAMIDGLIRHAENGGHVLFYGPLDHATRIAQLLGIQMGEPLEGDFHGEFPGLLRHTSFLSGGGWRECGGTNSVSADAGGNFRTACAWRDFDGGGGVGWVRGSLSTAEFSPDRPGPIRGPRLTPLDSGIFHRSEAFVHQLLERWGIVVASRPVGDSSFLTLHRADRAFVFSCYNPNARSVQQLSLPCGAPVFNGRESVIRHGRLILENQTVGHFVCRTFVKQTQGRITCRIVPAIQHGYASRWLLSGLDHADVTFFPEDRPGWMIEVLRQPKFPYFQGDFVEVAETEGWGGRQIHVPNVSGELLFSPRSIAPVWAEKSAILKV